MKKLFRIYLVLTISICASCSTTPSTPGEQKKIVTPEPPVNAESIVYNMPTVSFVTSDPVHKMGYISLTLVASPPGVRTELTGSMDDLSAVVNSRMCTKKAGELDSVDDIEKLKIELRALLNEKLKSGRVLKITIREIVVN